MRGGRVYIFINNGALIKIWHKGMDVTVIRQIIKGAFVSDVADL